MSPDIINAKISQIDEKHKRLTIDIHAGAQGYVSFSELFLDKEPLVANSEYVYTYPIHLRRGHFRNAIAVRMVVWNFRDRPLNSL